jgi:ribosomal protein L32
MLEEAEWNRLAPLLTNHIEEIKRIRKDQNCDLATAKRLVETSACDLYFEMTGFKETNINALWHHRLSIYGNECPKCGHLFRSPMATFCANCGLKKVEAEQTSERYGSKLAAR